MATSDDNFHSSDYDDNFKRENDGPSEGIEEWDSRYETGDCVGVGGEGTAFKALDRKLNRFVLLKKLKNATGQRSVFEAIRASRLEDPCLVPIYDVDSDRSTIVMRFIDGVKLGEASFLENTPIRDRILLIAEICRVVQKIHNNGIVHCDIKPSNILVADNQPYLIDFGVAVDLAEQKVEETLCVETPDQLQNKIKTSCQGKTVSNSSMARPGTLSMMSPQQANGHTPSPSDDVFLLAATLFCIISEKDQLYTGKKEEIKIAAQNCNIDWSSLKNTDATLLKIVRKGMAHLPEDRYQSAQALADDLCGFVEGKAVTVKEHWWRRLKRMAQSRPKTVAATATFVFSFLLLLASISFAWSKYSQKNAAIQKQLADQAMYSEEKAKAALLASEDEKKRTVRIVDYFRSRIIKAANPRYRHSNNQVTLAEVIRLIEQDLNAEFPNDKKARSAIQFDIASLHLAYRNLDDAKRNAEQSLMARRQLLGEFASNTLSTESLLLEVVQHQKPNDIESAIESREDLTQKIKNKLGDDSEVYFNSVTILGALYFYHGAKLRNRAENHEGGREKQKLKEQSQQAFSASLNWSLEAKQVAQKYLGSQKKINARFNYAMVLANTGNRMEAVDELKSCLAMTKKVFGNNHENVASVSAGLGRLYSQSQNLKFEALLEDVVRIQELHYGRFHQKTIVAKEALVNAYRINLKFQDSAKEQYEVGMLYFAKRDILALPTLASAAFAAYASRDFDLAKKALSQADEFCGEFKKWSSPPNKNIQEKINAFTVYGMAVRGAIDVHKERKKGKSILDDALTRYRDGIVIETPRRIELLQALSNGFAELDDKARAEQLGNERLKLIESLK